MKDLVEWQNVLFPFTALYFRSLEHYTLSAGIEYLKLGKRHELKFVQVSSSLCGGAVIGIFSWPNVPSTTWISQAFWLASLVLAMVSLQASAMQSTLLDSLPSTLDENISVDALDPAICTISHDVRCRSHSGHSFKDLERGRTRTLNVSWNMIFVWQFPIMTMTYAWVMFVLALTIYVCTPLINRDPWGPQSKIAVFYLIILGCAFTAFVWCSQSLRRIPINCFDSVQIPKGTSTKEDPLAVQKQESAPLAQRNKSALQKVLINDMRTED